MRRSVPMLVALFAIALAAAAFPSTALARAGTSQSAAAQQSGAGDQSPQTQTEPGPEDPDATTGRSAGAPPSPAPAPTPVPADGREADRPGGENGLGFGALFVTWLFATLSGAGLGAWLATTILRKRFLANAEALDAVSELHRRNQRASNDEKSVDRPRNDGPQAGGFHGGRDAVEHARQQKADRDDLCQQDREGLDYLDTPTPAPASVSPNTGVQRPPFDTSEQDLWRKPETASAVASAPSVSQSPPQPVSSQQREVCDALAGLLADPNLSRDSYDAAFERFGRATAVEAIEGQSVRLSSGHATLLNAYAIDGGEALALVPAFDFIFDFRSLYRRTLDLPPLIEAAFAPNPDDRAILSISALPTVRRNGEGWILTSRGTMSGFVRG